MSRFVPPRIAGVLVIGPILMLPATAVEAPSDSLRSPVCGTDLGSLPVAKARLLDVGDYRGPRHPTMRRLSDSSTRGWYLAGDSILPKQCAPFVQLRNSTDAEAKKIFNEDLKKYPHNCVALAGLPLNALSAIHRVLRPTLRKCPRIFHIVQSDRHAP